MTIEPTRRDAIAPAAAATAVAPVATHVDAFMQGIRWSNAQSLFERYSRET